MIVLNPGVLKDQVHQGKDLLHEGRVLRDPKLHLGDRGSLGDEAQDDDSMGISEIALIAEREVDHAVTISVIREQVFQTGGKSITSTMMERMRKSLMIQKTRKV